MFFSRVRLDEERVTAAELGRMVRGDQYAGHQLLWRLFSSGEGGDREQPRPFIFRQVADARMPTFYLVSDQPPENRDSHWRVETKRYEPSLVSGLRLQFDVRVNPVKRAKQPDGRHKRHDVVMHAKRQRGDSAVQREPRALEREVALAWLQERAAGLGFRVDNDCFAAFGYQQHVIHKRRGLPIRFSALDLRGVLDVTQVDVFRRTLFQGIGPSKGFGCGLLLVRPASL